MSRIFVTGDLHGTFDIWKLTDRHFEERGLDEDDYLIICGDFGLVWYFEDDERGDEDKKWLDWLEGKPWTTLFVDGNHENFDLLSGYPIEEWNGGQVQRIRDNVIHLVRGQFFDIAGKTFFAMGGAYSHDIEYRTEGVSWWKAEVPSWKEREEAIANLTAHDWKVDYVITHCGPTGAIPQPRISDPVFPDEYTDWLQTEIADKLQFKRWFFGHYHKDYSEGDAYRLLYYDFEEIKG